MKIFDCFTFFNELDLLEFRLKLLNDTVDYFVIAESNLTHSGNTKPYNFENARERFKKWEHKIIYIKIEQSVSAPIQEKDKQYNPGSPAWKLENEQRNALLNASGKMSDDDMVIVGDLDEMPNPAILKKINAATSPVALSLLFHNYFLNCQNAAASRWWNGSIVCSAKQFKKFTPQGLRNKRDDFPSISNAGWHFSFLGGVEKIKEKLQAFAHTEFSGNEFTNEKNITEALKAGADVLKREGMILKYVPLGYYPKKLQAVMKEYPKFIFPVKENPFVILFYFLRRIVKDNL